MLADLKELLEETVRVVNVLVGRSLCFLVEEGGKGKFWCVGSGSSRSWAKRGKHVIWGGPVAAFD